MIRYLPAFLPLLLVGFLASPAFSADDAPDKVVAYREVVMEDLSKQMKLTGMIVKGEVNRPADLTIHAEGMKSLATTIKTLFPAGSGPDKIKSEAKAEIWTKSADFAAACKDFEEQTAKLAEIAKGSDKAAFQEQFGKVGMSCKGCHDTFREEH